MHFQVDPFSKIRIRQLKCDGLETLVYAREKGEGLRNIQNTGR
jgi:hypothetical protein